MVGENPSGGVYVTESNVHDTADTVLGQMNTAAAARTIKRSFVGMETPSRDYNIMARAEFMYAANFPCSAFDCPGKGKAEAPD